MPSKLVIMVTFIGVMSCGQIVKGQLGEVKSYYADPNSASPFTFSTVGPSGFILTDVVFTSDTSTRITVREDTGGGPVDVAQFRSGVGIGSGATSFLSYHLNSGIPISPNAILSVSGVDMRGVTLSGYIPGAASSATVPAISSWGLAIMLMLLIGVATVVFGKKQLHHSETRS